jgi:DNA modification methylase
MEWIETEVKIKELKDYDRNPRRISKEQLAKLIKSIQEDGYRNRIVVDIDNTILGGHQRKKALRAAGFSDSDTIKVLKPTRKLTQEEFDRINVRDNGHFGDWDMDGLSNLGYEMEQLIDWGVPSSQFADMFAKEEDEEPEVEVIEEETEDSKIKEPSKIISLNGDIWLLGNHRLVCGDSFDVLNHEKLLEGKKADFCFIDPPYGIKIDEWDNPIDEKTMLALIDGLTKSDSFFAMTHQMPLMLDWLLALKNTSYKFKDHVVWVKRIATAIAQDITRSHESLMIYKKGKPEYIKTKGKYTDVKVPGVMFDVSSIDGIQRYIGHLQTALKRGGKKTAITGKVTEKAYDYMKDVKKEVAPEEVNFTNVWSFLPNNQSTRDSDTRVEHPTVKPIQFMQRVVELCANDNDIVLDMFLGSGTTLLACEKSNRKCYGFEMNPKYCDIIINRWQELTGQDAIHIESGKTYNQLLNFS